MIGIINYGSGNVGAIANIYKQLKIPHLIASDPRELESAERYILPGVGAFDATMRHLADSGLLSMLNEQVLEQKKKVLGICVGMQILANSSEEGSKFGLGWIPGHVRMIDAQSLLSNPKLPHMGWNSVNCKPDYELFRGIDAERGFYFLHSYYFEASDKENVLATVEYGGALTCAVGRENIAGVQFHPEKSHANGMAIFSNFSRW